MKEIKFRAWDKERKQMFSDDIISINKARDDEQTILMQFTGLKDKNGKEIYEGDICYLYPLRLGEPRCVIQIMFKECGFQMFSSDGKLLYVRQLYTENLHMKVEVIGNIYENPKLLKEK